MKGLFFLGAISLMSGCSSMHWHKDGASQENFANDHQYCALYARALNENTTWSRGFTENALKKQCMEERGWNRVPASN